MQGFKDYFQSYAGGFNQPPTVMNIGAGQGYPAAALSNFTPHPFTFRGIPVASMEGFLQGLKFKSPEMQKVVFQLVGKAAKFKGKPKKWWRDQTLYFQGQPIDRHSKEYQALLDEAFEAMFTQNVKAKKALLDSQNAVFTHTIGKSDPKQTVLTISEFCGRLTRIRERLKNV
jgi:predicted NAD-dependent protein-ADP-ribosyltransferase YbiA (DUF1768 family)